MVVIVGVSFSISKRGSNFCYRNELRRLDASQLLIIVFTVKLRQSLVIFSGPQILYLKWEGRNYFHSAVNEVEESKESKPQSLCMLKDWYTVPSAIPKTKVSHMTKPKANESAGPTLKMVVRYE